MRNTIMERSRRRLLSSTTPPRLGTNTMYPVKHLVVTGELTTGFKFYGPFESVPKAGQWAVANLKDGLPYRIHNLFEVKDEV